MESSRRFQIVPSLFFVGLGFVFFSPSGNVVSVWLYL